MSMPSWGGQRRPSRGRRFYKDLEDEENLDSKRWDRGQSWYKDGTREGKSLFDNEGCACHWHVLYRAQVQKFSRPGEIDVCSLGTYPNDISFSLYNLSIIPINWGVRKNFIQQHTLWVSQAKRLFFFCIYDKTPKYIFKWDYQPGLDPRDFG